MVQTIGSVQLGIGSVTMEGLVNFNKKFVLRRTGYNGKAMTPIKKTMWNIMRYEKWMERKFGSALFRMKMGV
jgi:hypothetical protein